MVKCEVDGFSRLIFLMPDNAMHFRVIGLKEKGGEDKEKANTVICRSS